MKTITKLFIPMVAFVILLTNLSTMAQHPQPERPEAKEDARTIIHRTKVVIEEAQRAVARGHVYNGDLAKAISHQHFAIKLYNQGFYGRAINHTIRARQLAFVAIRDNKEAIKAEWNWDPKELNYVKALPPESQLEREVATAKIDADLKDEKASTNTYGDLDLNIEVR